MLRVTRHCRGDVPTFTPAKPALDLAIPQKYKAEMTQLAGVLARRWLTIQVLTGPEMW